MTVGQRRVWLALEEQKRRRARRGPLLSAQSPGLIVWQWSSVNPVRWNVYTSFDGTNYSLVGSVAGNVFQYIPESGSAWTYIVGVDGNGNEITAHSNAVRPDDAVNPANVIVLNSDGHGHLTWTLNFTSDTGINIYQAPTARPGATPLTVAMVGARAVDESGAAGYFRICLCDGDGVDVPPFSNAVHSDGI